MGHLGLIFRKGVLYLGARLDLPDLRMLDPVGQLRQLMVVGRDEMGALTGIEDLLDDDTRGEEGGYEGQPITVTQSRAPAAGAAASSTSISSLLRTVIFLIVTGGSVRLGTPSFTADAWAATLDPVSEVL